jgi:heme/copper-type cytochrome/quinol oxidase subunit 2
MPYRPWGKIFAILLIAAGIMGAFVWKYMQTMGAATMAENMKVQVPAVVKPLYDLFGEKLFLVLGAVAAILFAAVSLKVVLGRPREED